MNAPSNPLKMCVIIKNHAHFEAMNDFIAFERHRVKDFTWYHSGFGTDEVSTLTIEFHSLIDAVIFKLTHG